MTKVAVTNQLEFCKAFVTLKNNKVNHVYEEIIYNMYSQVGYIL